MNTSKDAMIANRHTHSTSTSSADIAGHEGVDRASTGSSTCCYDGEVHVQCATTSVVAQAQATGIHTILWVMPVLSSAICFLNSVAANNNNLSPVVAIEEVTAVVAVPWNSRAECFQELVGRKYLK